jgi:pimeloyl-ACP methyl ester carboxylesterase
MNKGFQYGNRKIYYNIIGNGKPVILIHGFGEDGSVWKNQAEYLKEHFQCFVPDLPGSGKSELIDDMSIEGMAEVIHYIIHEENIDACPVVGHSMGGYIALALAEKYYNHVSGLGLFHSTAFADSEEKKENRRKGIEFIKQHGSFEFLKTAIPNLFSLQSKNEQPELTGYLLTVAQNFSTDALVSYYEAMMQRQDRTHVLKQTKTPVLFIMGKYDAAIPMEDTLKQCHLPEKSYIHILQKSGHMGMLEEVALSNNFLEKFLKDVFYQSLNV